MPCECYEPQSGSMAAARMVMGRRVQIGADLYNMNTCCFCGRFVDWDVEVAPGKYERGAPPTECGIVVKENGVKVWP